MKIAIAGFGSLGKAVEKAASLSKETELVGIFTKRPPQAVKAAYKTPVFSLYEAPKFRNDIDVMINCMGSASELPVITPYLAGFFNQADSFDSHKEIAAHIKRADYYAKKAGKLTLVGAGWDPGLFSLIRLLLCAAVPDGRECTFWGRGVSSGHSNAIKQLDGVADAVQYTVPLEDKIELAEKGELFDCSASELHRRICYVVPEPGADCGLIEEEIRNMPGYFSGYDVEIHFTDYESFLCEHSSRKHAGRIVGKGESSFADFSLKMDSNPDFTAGILISFASAVFSMNRKGKIGAISVFDIPMGELLGGDTEKLFPML